MDYQEYMKTELLILVPVLYFIGMGLKKSKLQDKWIPVAIGVTGILLAAVWEIATNEISGIREIAMVCYSAVTQGILAAGAAVYVNQLYAQTKK